MSPPKILNVGQCGVDHPAISGMLRKALNAHVEGADTHDEALETLRAGGFDLVLVNRVGDLDGAPGLGLIRAIKADPSLAETPVMLVSNLPDAQAEAVAAGALPGFGKNDLRGGAAEKVKAALGR